MQALTSMMPTTFSGRELRSRLTDSRWWWVLAILAFVALIVVHIVVAQSASAPRTPWDENAVIQLARVIAGQDDVTPMYTNGYYPLTSFLLAPVWWFTQDPVTVYGWSNVVLNVVGIATVLPLIGIARRVGLNLPQAITAASLAVCLPGHTALADYVLAEQPLQLVIALVAYTAMRYWQRGSVLNAAWFILSILAALFTHPRALVVAAVAGVWLLGLLLDRARRLSAVITLAVLVPASYLTVQLAGYMARLVVQGGSFGQGESLTRAILEPQWVLIAKVTALQSWAQLVGTLGMVSVGAVILVTWAWAELVRGRQFGPGVFILGLTVAGALISWLNWATERSHLIGNAPRFDSWVYTRYIDPFITVAVLLAIAALFTRLSVPMMAVSFGATALLCLATVYVFADTVTTWGSAFGPANIGALRAWEGTWPDEPFEVPLTPTLTNDNRFWLLASLTVLAAQALALALSRFPRVLGGSLIAGFTTYSMLSNPTLPREYPKNIESGVETVEEVLGREAAVDFDASCAPDPRGRNTAVNWLGYWLSPRDVDLVDASREDADADIIIACSWWPLGEQYEAYTVYGSNNYGYEVYVPAGPVQDALIESDEIRDLTYYSE